MRLLHSCAFHKGTHKFLVRQFSLKHAHKLSLFLTVPVFTATFTAVKILSLAKVTWKAGASALSEALRKAKETSHSSSKP